jgi:nucleoid DNA-binding protein
MNKSQLIATVAEQLEMPKVKVAAVVNTVIDSVVDAVSEGETVSLTGFGTFSSRDRAERQGRNPQTGDALVIPARKAPHFRPGRSFKTTVNG